MDTCSVIWVLFMLAFSVFAAFKVTADAEGWMKTLFRVGSIITVIAVLYSFVTPGESRDPSTSMTPVGAVEQEGVPEDSADVGSSRSTNSEPTYSDPRWPTTNAELLAIPEADRWYNSWKRVGSYGTIVGPVADVDILDDRIMVNIGADYPDPSRVQIVIWAERWEDFEGIIQAISVGDNWVSVSGEISEYDGVAEMDVNDSDMEWRWWTDVR